MLPVFLEALFVSSSLGSTGCVWVCERRFVIEGVFIGAMNKCKARRKGSKDDVAGPTKASVNLECHVAWLVHQIIQSFGVVPPLFELHDYSKLIEVAGKLGWP